MPAIRAAYDAEYTRFYDQPVPGSDVEVMSYGVTVATLPPPEAPPAPSVASAHQAKPAGTRNVRDTASGVVSDWAIFERDRLRPGARFAGPVIVAEAETSTLIGPSWSGCVTAEGYLELGLEVQSALPRQPDVENQTARNVRKLVLE